MDSVAFLSLTDSGRQQFSTSNGPISGLMKGMTVITHHSNPRSAYCNDSASVVRVEQLPVSSIISAKTIESWIIPDGDDALKASLGWLDEKEAPESPELALVLVFRAGRLREHRCLVGGKSRQYELELRDLYDFCPDLVTKDTERFPPQLSVKLDYSQIIFRPGKKTTNWIHIKEMFKDSLNCVNISPDWSKTFLYTRYRLRESALQDGTVLTLHLEALPLESQLDSVPAELRRQFDSSSNVVIDLLTIPLTFHKSVPEKNLFTSPYLLSDPSSQNLNDTIIRLMLDAIRDVMRSGRNAVNQEECVKSIKSPLLQPIWGRNIRRIHMPVSESVSLVETGKIGVFYLLSGPNFYRK